MRLTTMGPFGGIEDRVEWTLRGQNERPPYANFISRLVNGRNRLAATHHRTLFCQHMEAGVPPQGVSTPFYRYVYDETWPASNYLKHGALLVPPFTADPVAPPPPPPVVVPGLQSSIGGGLSLWEVIPIPAVPTDLRYKTFTEAHGGPVAGLQYRSLNAIGDFGGPRIVAVACEDRHEAARWDVIDTASGCAVNPLRFRATGPIVDGPLEDLRAAEHAEWLYHRPVVAAWCAKNAELGTPQSITGTIVPTNLIDGVTTVPSGSSPGEICPAQHAGRETETSVSATVAALVQVTAGLGRIDFVSSLNTITIPFAAGVPQFVSFPGLLLDTTIEADKVDIMAAPQTDPADTVHVWGWWIMITPV